MMIKNLQVVSISFLRWIFQHLSKHQSKQQKP